ncbi:MAG: selenide, water dikinase SelD [Candidatus Binatia bacterium]
MGPKDLGEILRKLPAAHDPNLLVGMDPCDDAAVYRLTPDLALVQTVDYITPLVDDPYTFGQIAAANSLSDVYAMGGKPLLALNVVAFPTAVLPMDVLAEILRGGFDKAQEADVRIVGGHSIDDREPKYGLAVAGLVHPDRVLRNSTARAGDHLILTKALGMGIVSTAIKRELASSDLIARAVEVMTTLNKNAALAAIEIGAHACTDVTGFGLLGHLREMIAAGRVGAQVSVHRVPVLREVVELAAQDVVPGGTKRNLAFAQEVVDFDAAVDPVQRLILADAQTSGGLLVAVAPERTDDLQRTLHAKGVPVYADIGVITDDSSGRIRVVP